MKQTMRIIFSRPLNEYELNTHNKKNPEKKQKKIILQFSLLEIFSIIFFYQNFGI